MRGVVGNKNRCTGTHKTNMGLLENRLKISRALGIILKHDVLTRNNVASNRQKGALGKLLDNITVEERWLDNYSRCAFSLVASQSLASMECRSNRLLVPLAVALEGGVHSITERSIHGRCLFAGVGHNANMAESILVKLFADSVNATIHHVAGAHILSTGLSIRKSHVCKDFNGGLIVNCLFMVMVNITKNSTVAVACVFAKTYITHDQELRERSSYSLGAANDRCLVASCHRSFRVLFLDDAKEHDCTKPLLAELLQMSHKRSVWLGLVAADTPLLVR
mmetsp:Transcript_21669/g.42560  ORF Transcript_21669/g.42560 Transcript_21669/m.42560 type:complete len:279 (+) Transcript_21669:173-1009(+)